MAKGSFILCVMMSMYMYCYWKYIIRTQFEVLISKLIYFSFSTYYVDGDVDVKDDANSIFVQLNTLLCGWDFFARSATFTLVLPKIHKHPFTFTFDHISMYINMIRVAIIDCCASAGNSRIFNIVNVIFIVRSHFQW